MHRVVEIKSTARAAVAGRSTHSAACCSPRRSYDFEATQTRAIRLCFWSLSALRVVDRRRITSAYGARFAEGAWPVDKQSVQSGDAVSF